MRIVLENNRVPGIWTVSNGETTIVFQWLNGPADLLRLLADRCEGPVSAEEWAQARQRLTTVASRLRLGGIDV